MLKRFAVLFTAILFFLFGLTSMAEDFEEFDDFLHAIRGALKG